MLFHTLLMYWPKKRHKLASASIPVTGQVAFYSVSVKADNATYLAALSETDIF